MLNIWFFQPFSANKNEFVRRFPNNIFRKGLGRSLRPVLVLIVIATGIAFNGAAPAQTVDLENPGEVQRRSQEEIERTSRAAERARLQRILDSGGDVSYADVLKDPDNIPLNFRFAQTQIRRGDVRGASATLERILLLDPDRPDVRLLYAVVLFRLDNLQDAERELLAVRNLPMKPALRAEIEGFLSQIQQRRKRLRFDVLVNFTGQYDWNGNSAARRNIRLVSDVPILNGEADERHREFSANATARAAFTYDLGLQRRHSVSGAITAYRTEHLHEDQLDLEVGAVEAAMALTYEPVTLTPRLSASKIRLAHQRYLTLTRGELEALYQVTKKTELSATAGGEDHHYNSLNVSSTANEKEGRQIDFELGASHLIEPTVKIGGHVRVYDKNAKRPFNTYHRYEVGAESTVLLTGGRFVIATLTLQKDSYKAPDTFTSSDTRNDTTMRARILFGFPLSNLFGPDYASLVDGITATLSAERFRSGSNIPDYDYRNTTMALGLSRKWTFLIC